MDIRNHPAKVVQTDSHLYEERNHDSNYDLLRVTVLSQQDLNKLICEDIVLFKPTQVFVKGPAICKPADFDDSDLNGDNLLFCVFKLSKEKGFYLLATTLLFFFIFVQFFLNLSSTQKTSVRNEWQHFVWFVPFHIFDFHALLVLQKRLL